MPQQQDVRPIRPTTTYATAAQPSDPHVVEHADEMLDEIDAILAEENEFLVRYHQRGGQ